jgi:urease subunit alpha
VLKGGFAAWSALGSGSGSTRLGEPLVYAGLFGALGAAPPALSTLFVSEAGVGRARERWPGPVAQVRGARSVRKRDLVRNGVTPTVEVDPVGERVLVEGEAVALAPATEVPLNLAYFVT